MTNVEFTLTLSEVHDMIRALFVSATQRSTDERRPPNSHEVIVSIEFADLWVES
jgi:hypothetical protein